MDGGKCLRWRPRSRVFPAAVLPYLVWRRQWATAASMVVFLAVFLFILPAPFRGFQHNAQELKTWYSGHGRIELGEGVWPARRAELVLGQSVDHRGYPPPDAPAQLHPGRSVRYRRALMNVVDLDFEDANWIVLAARFAWAWLPRGDAASVVGLKVGSPRSSASRSPEDRVSARAAVLFYMAVLPDHGSGPSRRL